MLGYVYMKKFLSLITAILMTVLLCTGCKSEEKRLATSYTDMFEDGKAYISCTTEYESDGMKVNQLQNIAMDGENMAMQIAIEIPDFLPVGIESKVILKDKQLYIVDNFQQQVITINLSDQYEEFKEKLSSESSLFTTGTDDLEFIKSDNEEFKGEKLFYEEYKAPVGNCKYYFKDKTLVGMSVTTDLLPEPFGVTVNEISEIYPEEIFTIPEGYTKVTAEEADLEFDLDQMFPN